MDFSHFKRYVRLTPKENINSFMLGTTVSFKSFCSAVPPNSQDLRYLCLTIITHEVSRSPLWVTCHVISRSRVLTISGSCEWGVRDLLMTVCVYGGKKYLHSKRPVRWRRPLSHDTSAPCLFHSGRQHPLLRARDLVLVIPHNIPHTGYGIFVVC